MSKNTEKATEYAVARGNEVITWWTPDLATAQQECRLIEQSMRTAHLEPDVHVVQSEVEYVTNRSRAKRYEEPEPQEEPVQAGLTPSDGSAVLLGAGGAWGGDPGTPVPAPMDISQIVASQGDGAPTDSAGQTFDIQVNADGVDTTDTPRMEPSPDFNVPADGAPTTADPAVAKEARQAARSAQRGTSKGASQGTGKSVSKGTGGGPAH
jgi:hypothetical protein